MLNASPLCWQYPIMTNKGKGGGQAPNLDEDIFETIRSACERGNIGGQLALHALIMQREGARHAADMPPLPPRSANPASAGKKSPALWENEDAPAYRDADAPIAREIDAPTVGEEEKAPASRDADAPVSTETDAPVSREEEETRGQSIGGNETANARPPKTWEVRLSNCKDLVREMDRTLVCCAASACVEGPSALAGFVNPLQDSVKGEIKGGVIRQPSPDQSTTVGGEASDDSESDLLSLKDEHGTLKIPRVFRITSRRVYGRILSFHGFSGHGSPYAIVGSAVNIPQKTQHPEGSNVSVTIVVLAPLANLGRNPSLDGGNAKPLCDMAVGMPVVGTLDCFNDGSSKARFGYIEWTLASSAEWSLEAPRSFFSLEHMISTDILNWSLKSLETEILLPQGAQDSLFVVYASD